MLLKQHLALEAGHQIKIEKHCNGEDVSLLGAFEKGTVIEFCATVPRRMGIGAVVMRICPDGEEAKDMPFAFLERRGSCDLYTLSLSTSSLCGKMPHGLFYYEFLFLRGFDTLFSDSVNNVDFTLADHSASHFRLLICTKGFCTPQWFHGGIMYHVFLDRFFRGEGEVALHPGSVLDENWESGIPQYAQKAGDALANNVFFGGNLWGVAQKLDYLQSLGVTVLYLSPIFESVSNHRYDTASYEEIDSLLGGQAAFDTLIREAHARGIRVILDGVFNHTGDDSIYFNRRGNYPTQGAYQSKDSPYADWYTFKEFPEEYESWWGIEIMPRLNHAEKNCRRFFTGPDGIAARWLRAGADGWRLDVADELSDAFLEEFHDTVKRETNGQGILIGEVWENAADKIAYGKRRRYFRGEQLDSVMNYPFRNAVMALLLDRDAETFCNILTELYASYPPTVSHSLMNLLGTHDTERILTVLGDPDVGAGLENPKLATLRLSAEARREAMQLLRIASILQFTVYGVPSIYYGDEVGMEGYHDPFCRMPFPWGREDEELLAHYRALGALRHRHKALDDGSFCFLYHDTHAFLFERRDSQIKDRLLVAVNMGEEPCTFTQIPQGFRDALTGDPITLRGGCWTLTPQACVVLESRKSC